jgi:2-methylcitrate dehydratase
MLSFFNAEMTQDGLSRARSGAVRRWIYGLPAGRAEEGISGVDSTLADITEFVGATSAGVLPVLVLDRARDILVDTLGCAVGGRDCPAAAVASGLASTSANGDGVVIGVDRRAPTELAAFWNSAMIRYLDFNDTGAPSAHPSDMIGAHVALSRMAGAGGRDMLTALVIGHEVYNRITDRLAFDDRRLDSGYATALGVAAAGAFLLRLSAEQTRHALAFAATSALSTRAVRAGQLSTMKGFASALAAKEAVFYLQLARAGLTGPAEPFDGRHGVAELMTGQAGALELAPFDDWTILRCKLKYWPAAYNTQPAIWAAVELRDRLMAGEVESVRLGVNTRAWHESGSEVATWDPQNREAARHSIPYLFSRAFVDGVIDEESFDLVKIRDPVIGDLMKRVQVVVDPVMEAQRPKLLLGCRAEAIDTGGAPHAVYIDGTPGVAATWLTRDQIADKFLRLTRYHLGASASEAFDAAWNTAAANDFQQVLTPFRAA